MKIADILTPECTQHSAPAGSKKRVLEYLSHFVADKTQTIEVDTLYQQLLAREKLGSTGLGSGVAIPHCRVSGCDEIRAALLQLEEPVDFDSIDDKPVDIVFALIVPDEQNDVHLQVLSSIAQLLQEDDNLQKLRNADSNEKLYQAVTVGN